MKSLMAILVVAMAVPAMAVVNFTASDAGSQQLLIAYNSPEGDAPRGVALRVAITGGMVDFAAPVEVDGAFNAYIDYAYSNPLTYNLDAGKGHPLAKATEAGALTADAADFSISMGVLDQTGAQKPGPTSTTKLIKIQLKGIADGGSATVLITADTLRGPSSGVVGSVLTSNLPLAAVTVAGKPVVTECVKNTASFYADWVAWGKPNCWCYERQCRGDLNGKKDGVAVKYYVSGTDLGIFKTGYALNDAALKLVNGGICGDMNHKADGVAVKYRVSGTDLTQFKLYYAKADASVPSCPNTDYNFWMVP